MTREDVYKEMDAAFGLVPSFMKHVPDNRLELEWKLILQAQFAEGPIPNKYRELIGVAISAATRCKYCTYFHAAGARLEGATEAEIEDAISYAKSTMGWSTYVNGMQEDYNTFVAEVDAICEHVRNQKAASAN